MEDFEKAAADKLPKGLLEYFNGGAGRELTLRSNLNSLKKYFLKPQILSSANHLSCSAVIQNKTLSLPIGIAPTAFHRLAHEQGELATFIAAKKTNTIYIISCLATISLLTLRRAGLLDNVWLQMLTFKDRALMKALIEQAQTLKCQAIVITVDAPVSGNRQKDLRNRFILPPPLRMEILHEHLLLGKKSESPGSMLDNFFNQHVDPHFSWEDVRYFASSTDLPIILKGILRLEDAKKAIDNGVKGIIISNHGGRQLDGAISSMHALEAIACHLKDQIEIYIDGGFRSGNDVFKALALGAKAVFLGRPILWGLAQQGQEGVEAVLALFKKELCHTMQLCGVSTLAEINRSFICQ